MKRQDLIYKLSPEHRERLKNLLDDINEDRIFSYIPLCSHIIREIASSIYRKKSSNVPADINPFFLDELIQFISYELFFIPKPNIWLGRPIYNTKIDVISMIKLRAILNDIHREFKRILQENEA